MWDCCESGGFKCGYNFFPFVGVNLKVAGMGDMAPKSCEECNLSGVLLMEL
jgi:hypothetical protein